MKNAIYELNTYIQWMPLTDQIMVGVFITTLLFVVSVGVLLKGE